MQIFIDIVNKLIDVLVVIAMFAINLLPESPFQFEPFNWGPFGGLVGLFIPVEQMGVHMTAILGAYLMYYAVRWLLRIIRQIQ